MPRKKRKEEFYYRRVQRFLRDEMGCVVHSFNNDGKVRDFIGKGFGGHIVDVYGIRGVEESGSRELQGLAVEVKRSTSRTSPGHILQASKYGRLAHRCYLAQPREFGQKNKAEASRLGVGLLQMSKSGRSVKLISESRPFSPDPETFYMFIHKSLRIVRCGLCSCYLFRYRDGKRGVAVNGHWVSDDLSPSRGRKKLNKKMYICQKCEEAVSGIAKTKKLQKTIRRLESRVKKVQEKLRQI